MAEEEKEEKVDIEAELSALAARARARGRRSALLTLVLVAVTGAFVLVFASDINHKRSEVAQLEAQKRRLDDELRTQQQKVEKAERAGEELDAKVEKLKEERKKLEDYIRTQRVEAPAAAAKLSDAPSSVVLAAEDGAQDKLVVVPHARLAPTNSKRAFDVVLSIDVPTGDMSSIASVTYELNPIYYFVKRELVVEEPPFEAKVTVYLCKSTVLVKVKMKDGSKMEVDFDWCRANGWPAPQPEEVIEQPPPEEVQGRRPPDEGGRIPPNPPGTTNPRLPR